MLTASEFCKTRAGPTDILHPELFKVIVLLLHNTAKYQFMLSEAVEELCLA